MKPSRMDRRDASAQNKFDAWMTELIALAPEYESCGYDEFGEQFEDGMTPQQAIDEDRSYGE